MTTKVRLRTLYLGMLGPFSLVPLLALLEAGIEVCGVVLPAGRKPGAPPIVPIRPDARGSDLPILNPYLSHTIATVSWEHGLPVYEVGKLSHPATYGVLASLRPDVGCVACFPYRIPASLRPLPNFGFLNLHPSLLPAYRGPAPLFWTFRNGEQTTGVTVHFMDEGLDTGDLALQAPLQLPDGLSGAEADRLCAERGAKLLVEAIQALAQHRLARRPQPPGGSTYPAPTAEDFTIPTTWSARRAFTFICGTAEYGQPYRVKGNHGDLIVSSALAYTENGNLGQAYTRSESEILIQFTPGILRARLLASPSESRYTLSP